MRHLAWPSKQLVLSVIRLLVVAISATSLVHIKTVKRSAWLILRFPSLIIAVPLVKAVSSPAALELGELSLVISQTIVVELSLRLVLGELLSRIVWPNLMLGISFRFCWNWSLLCSR